MNLIIKKLFQKKFRLSYYLLMDGYFFDMRKMKSKSEFEEVLESSCFS